MALHSDRVYFPPLEEALKGDRIVLSWKAISDALSDTNGVRQSTRAVVDFFEDPFVLDLVLHNRQKAFEKPSAQSKADFETKTAAINLTPTPTDRYDTKQIKDDALWLSSCANVSEVVALRIVAIEFQSRAKSHLLGPLSTQDTLNLQEAVGASNGRTSTLLLPLDINSTEDAEDILTAFETEASRRRRQLNCLVLEKRCFYMTADMMTTLLIHGRLPSAPSTPQIADMRRTACRSFGIASEDEVTKVAALRAPDLTWLEEALQSCRDGVSRIKDQSYVDEELELELFKTDILRIIHGLSMVFQGIDMAKGTFIKADVVSSWFKTMETYGFFDGLQDPAAIPGLVAPLKCLACAISLALLNLPRASAYLSREADLQEGEDCYLHDGDTLAVIHDAVSNAAGATLATGFPVCFTWALILFGMYSSLQERVERRDFQQSQTAQIGFELGGPSQGPGGRRLSAGSVVSMETAPYDHFLSDRIGSDASVIEGLAMSVTANGLLYDVLNSMTAFLGVGPDAFFSGILGSKIRLVFLDFLTGSFGIVGYLSDSVTALLSVLSGGQGYWDIAASATIQPEHDVLAYALNDSAVLENYFYQALNRFPYEYAPFISLCRAMASCVTMSQDANNSDLLIRLLTNTPSITFTLPAGFQEYDLVQEDENTNAFRLIADLPLFAPVQHPKLIGWHGDEAPADDFTIPAGAYGRFAVDQGEVVQIQFVYSALSLLGRLLEGFRAPGSVPNHVGTLDGEMASDTISLLATLIHAETVKSRSFSGTSYSETAVAILQEASRDMSRDKDVIGIVCDILEGYIQQDISKIDDVSISIITSCMQFVHAIIPICPARVWAHMAKSDLLNNESQAGRLSRITGSLDLSPDRLALLLSAMRLCSALVDNAVTIAVQRKVGSKPDNRHKDPESPWSGISEKVLAQVTLSIAQTFVDVFENSATWRFPSDFDRSLLLKDVVPILDNIILYAFRTGSPQSKDSLVSYLRPAAAYVVEAFLSPSAGLRFEPLLATLMVGFYLPSMTIYPYRLEAMSRQLVNVLGFATTLVRVGNLLERPLTIIEGHLFKGTPLLARLCAVSDSFRGRALTLLDVLVRSAGGATGEPPSLLGYLSPQISRSFLQVLSTVDRPFNQVSEVKRIWAFFSAVVRNRQQWMSNCLITGKSPREAAKGGGDKRGKEASESVLTAALERLATIETIPTEEALAILDFVTAVQNHLPRTIFSMLANSAFISGLRRYAHDMKPDSIIEKKHGAVEAALQVRVAAYIAETFAMQLYHLRQMGRAAPFATELIQDLDYYVRYGVEVRGYNRSLHANFAKNFAKQYPCTLDDFRLTGLTPRSLGPDYLYSLSSANMMLGYDPSWSGRKNNGFRHEMEKANTNLSLVDAQKALFDAWESLLLELSSSLTKSEPLFKQMWQVAEQCLRENQAPSGSGPIFDTLPVERAELSLLLVQRLAGSSPALGDVNQMLGTIWATINSIEQPYSPQGLAYHRLLLRILYVTLRAYNRSQKKAKPDAKVVVAVTQTMLNIVDKVVARGFRDVASLLHDPNTMMVPEDIQILTAILQASLLMPGMSETDVQLLNIMVSHDVLHIATSLYSWSDKLTTNGDPEVGRPGIPVFAEPALLFLVELSTIAPIAEQLACDGLLDNLASARMTQLMDRPGVGPFVGLDTNANPNPVGEICYSAWSRGLLPLLLNIFVAVGPPIAGEVAAVLSRFPTLLRGAVDRLEAPGGSRIPGGSGRRRRVGFAFGANGGPSDDGTVVTLRSVEEVHTLALLSRSLAAVRNGALGAGSGAGVRGGDAVPELPPGCFDEQALLENVEFWLSRRAVLRERIVPLPGTREVEWAVTKPTTTGKQMVGLGVAEPPESLLEEKVVSLLELVRAVLSNDGSSGPAGEIGGGLS